MDIFYVKHILGGLRLQERQEMLGYLYEAYLKRVVGKGIQTIKKDENSKISELIMAQHSFPL